MRALRKLMIGALPALLLGCSSSPADLAMTAISGRNLGAETAEMQRLVAAGAPQMIVWLLDQDRATTLVLAGTRDGVARWRAADNVQIYTRDGMIIGTRGLSFDLMTADVGAAGPVITSGRSGQITRIHRQLDGQDRMKITSYICDILPAGSETIRTGETSYASTLRVDEQCFSPSGDIENRYWLRDGQILQSEQIFNRDVGRIRILFLH
jgi:hypothetical protein